MKIPLKELAIKRKGYENQEALLKNPLKRTNLLRWAGMNVDLMTYAAQSNSKVKIIHSLTSYIILR